MGGNIISFLNGPNLSPQAVSQDNPLPVILSGGVGGLDVNITGFSPGVEPIDVNVVSGGAGGNVYYASTPAAVLLGNAGVFGQINGVAAVTISLRRVLVSTSAASANNTGLISINRRTSASVPPVAGYTIMVPGKYDPASPAAQGVYNRTTTPNVAGGALDSLVQLQTFTAPVANTWYTNVFDFTANPLQIINGQFVTLDFQPGLANTNILFTLEFSEA